MLYLPVTLLLFVLLLLLLLFLWLPLGIDIVDVAVVKLGFTSNVALSLLTWSYLECLLKKIINAL